MAFQFSTGLKDAILDTGSLKAALDDGYIRVYSGAVPAGPDATLGGATLLNTYSDADQGVGAGQGLDFAAEAVAGVLGKAAGQTWSGTAVASGAATFWRWVLAADDGSASSTAVRIQGTIGGAGADLFVQSTSFVAATAYSIDYFSVAIP